MARRSTSGWELVGGLIGVGVAVGVAYTVHTKIQEAINHMPAIPLDQALEELAASVPSLEDDVWDIFAGVLRSRTSESLRARQLLAFAIGRAQ